MTTVRASKIVNALDASSIASVRVENHITVLMGSKTLFKIPVGPIPNICTGFEHSISIFSGNKLIIRIDAESYRESAQILSTVVRLISSAQSPNAKAKFRATEETETDTTASTKHRRKSKRALVGMV